jgi:energy-coupling factor transport system ATP-binding protein
MKPVCSVHKLRLKFPGTDSLFFKDITISISKGEKVLLLGPSGCGKSTLLQVLAGLIPRTIEVPMKAESIQTPASWGYVFQDPDSQFCMPYVDEELAFTLENRLVPREQMADRIKELLQLVDLQLDTPHTPIQKLSGGMKQRLAIASALAGDPDVLFLDEPTAMIDPEGTEEVWRVLKCVASEKTIIIVEHKIDLILDWVDRIVLFNEHGEVIANGPAKLIFQQYQETIDQHGIWYPGCWDRYQAKRSNKRKTVSTTEILRLEQFQGLRNKRIHIEVEKAVVYQGEWIAITGSNGAGKSTLLQAIIGFIPTKGTCIFRGQTVHKMKQMYEQIGFVFQQPEFQFVTNSVYDELAYGLRLQKRPEVEIEPIVHTLLEQFHLNGLCHQHPYQLSVGQKRRLSVAASIVHHQPLLLLDEPTFGQDAQNTFALLERLEHLREQGTTILMVTHDTHVVDAFATRRWEITNGRLVRDEPIHRLTKELVGSR